MSVLTLLKKPVKYAKRVGMDKIPGVLSIYRFVLKLFSPKGLILINTMGSRMYVDGSDTGMVPSLLVKGVYEPFETKLVNRQIKKGMTVVNIGANVGYYTLMAARRVGPSGKVYAFEPEPQNYELLVRNIRENRYKNAIPINSAVSNKKGNLKLFLDKSNRAAPSLAKGNVANTGTVNIFADTLDRQLSKYRKSLKVDFILMDTQGSEGLIFEGANKVLKSKKIKIIMEFWPYGLRNMGTNSELLLEKIGGYGFMIKVIDERAEKLRRLSNEEIIRLCDSRRDGRGAVSLFLERKFSK